MKIFGHYYLFPQAVAWIPLYIVWKLFGRLEVYGKDNLIGLKSPVIFAPNHMSELDPIVFPARGINPFDSLMHIYHVSREKDFYNKTLLKRIFYGGLFFKLVGAYPAIVGKKDYSVALSTHVGFLKDGKNVCVFPEGRKTPDGNIQEAKGGVIHLAKETGAPIVPVALSGYYRMTLREFFFRKRRMAIMYGKPIHLDQLVEDIKTLEPGEYKNIANQVVMSEIKKMYKELDRAKEIEPMSARKPATQEVVT